MKEIKLTLPDVAATELWAARLAGICRPGDCITLSGPLGAGKTTFARAFIRAILGPVEVTSPTFTLLNIHDGPQVVYHADLYRLKSAGELAELGLEEAAEGILLVEWPEIAGDALPGEKLALAFSLSEELPQARIMVGNPTVKWYDRLKEAGFIE